MKPAFALLAVAVPAGLLALFFRHASHSDSMTTRYSLPERFRPIQLRPGDLDHDCTEAANRRRRAADLRAAARLMRWPILAVACLATGGALFVAWLIF